MALAALIFASHTVDDDEQLLCAALPLAGATLLEHQVRRAIRAGASHIVLLVERMPQPLLAAIDRLKRDSIRIDVARSVADAADRIHPQEDVLVIDDGCIADTRMLIALGEAGAPAALAVADQPGMEAYERIDARSRWGGVALIDGARLHATAEMLGEWDFALTLLRRALQDGATLLPVADDEAPVLARMARDLDRLEQRIIAGAAGLRDGWPGRYLFPLIEQPFFGRLARSNVDPWWIGVAGAVLALMGIPFASVGLFWPALLLLLVSGPVASLARRLADVRMTRLRNERLLNGVRRGFAATLLLLLGWRLGMDGAWGWTLLAALGVGGMWLLGVESRIARAVDNRGDGRWIATDDAMAWLLLPCALVGGWEAGVAILAAYAFGSFVATQRRLARGISARNAAEQV